MTRTIEVDTAAQHPRKPPVRLSGVTWRETVEVLSLGVEAAARTHPRDGVAITIRVARG
jgi:hypothetical protein